MAGCEDGRCAAAEALCNICVTNKIRVAVMRAGGITPLVEMVRGGTSDEKTAAAGALRTLSLNVDNQVCHFRV